MSKKYDILFIDDEVEILNIYKDMCQENLDEKFNIVTFESPVKAKEYILANHKKIAMIFSDYKMPDTTGFELRQQILGSNLYIPFVVITAHYTKEMAKQALDLSITNLLSKPFDTPEVISLLNNHSQQRIQQLEEEEEMINGFLEETQPMIEEIEELILVLEDDPQSIETINTYFRLLHTIKGTAACLGLNNVSQFAHKYEDFISLIKNGDQVVTRQVIDILLGGFDELKTILHIVTSNMSDEDIDLEKHLLFLKSPIESEDTNQPLTQAEGKPVHQEYKATKQKENMSVSLELLDEFMELSGEVTVLRNSLLKSFKTIESLLPQNREIDKISDSLNEMYKVTTDLQTKISEMRKVSLTQVFRPFKRVIRDIAKKNNKIVDFVTIGDELRVDGQIAKILSNSLIHMIRNSVDHGIETIDGRKEAGKNEEGEIRLSASDEGEFLRIILSDNGRGLNPETIKAVALKKGLYEQKQLDSFNEKKIFGMIFESGFSTAAQITDVSGRGVGMDMVKSSITQKGGTIDIQSTLGEGTKFVIDIPYPKSILIINSLLIVAQNQKLIIATEDITDVLILENKEKEAIQTINHNHVLHYRDKLIPLINLREELSFQLNNEEKDNPVSIVVLKSGSRNLAILVDEIIDLEEIVKRKIWTTIQEDVKVFDGASVLGTGEIALVLNVEYLFSIYEHGQLEESSANEDHSLRQARPPAHQYLSVKTFNDKEYLLEFESIFRLESISSSQIEYALKFPLLHYRGRPLPLFELENMMNAKFKDLSNLPQQDLYSVILLEGPHGKSGCLVKKIGDIVSTHAPLEPSLDGNQFIKGTTFLNNRTFTVIEKDQLEKTLFPQNSPDSIETIPLNKKEKLAS